MILGTYIFICCLLCCGQICVEAGKSNNRPNREETDKGFHYSAAG